MSLSTSQQVVRGGEAVRVTGAQLRSLEEKERTLRAQLMSARADIADLIASSANPREYDPTRARREQERDQYEFELTQVERTLAVAQVIPEEGCGSMEVTVGSRVTVKFVGGPQTGKVLTCTITTNGDVGAGLISELSPLAQAIMGRSCEEEGEFNVNDITHRVKIVDIK